MKSCGCILSVVVLVVLALLLMLVASASHWGLDKLTGTWASSKATGGDREGLRGAQDRLRVEYVGDCGGLFGGPTHVDVDGTVGDRRIAARVEVGAWSLLWQELRLELEDSRWTLEVDDGLLVVTAPDGRQTKLAKLR
ncbi:MAG: hypothetical protein JW767_00245 [Thermoleophilia bacterium]|nr:hypothetical protein [Thermoleophilia bacterium]